MTTQIQLPTKLVVESKFLKVKYGNLTSVNIGAKRGRMEIIAEILLFCDQQRAKTNIMYKTNLNYAQLKSQLRFLIAQGMLSHHNDKYATTEKGFRFLELFLGIYDILNNERL